MIRTLAMLVVVAMGAPTAHAEDSDELAKKHREWQAKAASPNNAAARASWVAKLERRVGKDAPDVINVYNTWTNEWIAVDADKKAPIGYDQATLDRFLRDHFTNQPTQMDPRLFPTLIKAARHFKTNRVHVISGYRSPKYNLILRKKGGEVARKSQHTLGHAVDFRLPRISTKRLHAWARKLRMGGVGKYLRSAFIHVDVGPVRYWEGT